MPLANIPIFLLLLSLVVGQLVRFPLPGQGGGWLLSDIATVLVLITAFLHWLLKRTGQQMTNDKIRMTKAFRHLSFLRHSCLVISPFLIWSLFTLFLHFSDLGRDNFLIAFFYWLRLTATLLLFPALLLLFQKPVLRTFTQRAFVMIIFTVALLGFLQLTFFPNLSEADLVLRSLGEGGWDPHQGRLVSTWLDPNFIGGFFAITLPWLASAAPLLTTIRPRAHGRGEERPRRMAEVRSSILLITILIALLLTQSRSSFVALAAGSLVSAPLWLLALRTFSRSFKFASLIVSGSALLAILIFPALLTPSRIMGLLFIDDTASLRLDSLRSAWQLAEAHPVLGVGYNAYQFAAREAGFGGDFTIHSRAGADNSTLTLWVTTGLIGVVLFFAPWVAAAMALIRRAARSHLTAAAAVTSLTILFIHSQFVNSFLYSHLLIALIVIIAITMSNDEIRMTKESSNA